MRILSWNINGYRSCVGKGFWDFIGSINPDIICLQETKMSAYCNNANMKINGYFQYWNYAKKKGYSGTAVFSKYQANLISDEYLLDDEGRIIALEYDSFYLVNCYSPQVRRDLSRLSYRLDFDTRLQNFLYKLNDIKPIILCGDLNVAYTELDLKNPKANNGHAGFTNEERQSFSELLNIGFIDSFRYLFPNRGGAYTWWSYRKGVRERNIGWRLDYVLISLALRNDIVESKIYETILGSDHCPVGIDINL